jgi:catechol 2,3-dioxygenase-like lactoylglutathione lyase family enzyme
MAEGDNPAKTLSLADIPYGSKAKLLDELPLRLHHHAFTVKDQEVNRHFMEDILGIPLVATWCERTFREEVGRDVEYCHTFFELADGGALAFFQWDDPEAEELFKAILHPRGTGSWHLALKATRKTFDEIHERLKAHDVPVRVIDHGYCLSLYVKTPDGLRIEFTVDADDWEQLAMMRRQDAHSELKRWLAGDHRPNNDDRAH